MARFNEELIRRLKTETDIVALIESYGTKLKPRSGGELIGLCPIHDDKNPSLVVNRQKNLWDCLGACGKGGDVLEWVMHAERASFRHAVELLRGGATGSTGGRKFTTDRKLNSPITNAADEQATLIQAVNYYHERLKESPAAMDYLRLRGIAHEEAIEQFQIGFVDRTLGLRLPAKTVKSGREVRERLKDIGLLRNSGHEHFRGCITFPLFSEVGRVDQMYGRRIDGGQRSSGKHFYLPCLRGGIFNLPAFQACDELILCESVIDALTFWVHGYRNVTTIYGTNGLTSDILHSLKRHHIQRLLLAFDADEAGNNAVDKHSEKFTSLGIELFRLKMTETAKDINNYARIASQDGGDVRDWLGALIRNAQWLGKGQPPAMTTQTPDFLQRAREQEAEVAPQGAAKKKKVAVDSVTPGLTHESESTAAPSTSEKASSVAASIPGVRVAGTPEPSPLQATNGSGPLASERQLTSSGGTVAKPQASPQPAAPREIEAEIAENGVMINVGNRTYRIRGMEKNLAFDMLKLNVMVRRDDRFYIDTFDLYAAKARAVFIREAARELGFDPEVIKRDLGQVLLKLESLQDKQIEDALAPKNEKIELSDKDKQAALELLKQPNLIERILTDFDACGVVGEETNKLVGYLAATSRKLDKPLAVLIQSSSAAGKSSLMEAVLSFMPPEEVIKYSAMTGQSLFYMGSMDLKHKILSIAEEEGVAQASYALKLLQSEGQLTIASTGKDPGTGRMETQEYHVEGPMMNFLTTTAIDIDEELLNRYIVLTVDENREQTRAIHDQQRKNETLTGLLTGKQSSVVHALHQNAQRLLRTLHVVNPFADQLDFCDDQARRRRDHVKYLTLIRSITLLHQYQRELKTASLGEETVQYIEVELSDIVLANRLADQVLGKSIDELPPQTRRLLIELYQWVQAECQRLQIQQRELRFTRRMIREALGWGQTTLKKHLERLIEMEYVLVHCCGTRRSQYELLYDGRGREGQPTMCGLLDVTKLKPGKSGATDGSKPQRPCDSTKSQPRRAASSPSGNGSSPLSNGSSPPDPPQSSPSSPSDKHGKPTKNSTKSH